MQEIELDKIVNLVVKEVVEQLKQKGVKVVQNGSNQPTQNNKQNLKTRVEKIDMSKYKSPILTEGHLKSIHELTGKVIVPEGTIITPKAREIIKHENLEVGYE